LPPAPVASQVLWLRALHRQGDLDSAHKWALAAEGLAALGPSAAGVASLVAFDLSDYASAMRWSNVALAQGPQMEALVTRASLALGERDPGKALALAGSALELNPKDGRAWSVKAFALLLAMDLPAAKQSFDQAVAAMPGHIGTWHGLAWTQLLSRDIDGAQTSFETALALDRTFGESHGGLAVVLVIKQQAQAAKGHIDRALRLDKTSLSARYAQALLGGEVRDAQAMQRLAQRLLGGRPAPLGGMMADWLTSVESTRKENGPGKAH
jgi:Tfp pilus assembly protein PilF